MKPPPTVRPNPPSAPVQRTSAQLLSLILERPELYALLRSAEDHLETLLDQALEATFPASDPIAVSRPVT